MSLRQAAPHRPQYLSGWCGTAQHHMCRGTYAGADCRCGCHQPAPARSRRPAVADELDTRLRALEAERLRPVPPAPARLPSPVPDPRRTDARQSEDAMQALRAAGRAYRANLDLTEEDKAAAARLLDELADPDEPDDDIDPEPPGPRDPAGITPPETTREDR